jgi:hypothetical protein
VAFLISKELAADVGVQSNNFFLAWLDSLLEIFVNIFPISFGIHSEDVLF